MAEEEKKPDAAAPAGDETAAAPNKKKKMMIIGGAALVLVLGGVGGFFMMKPKTQLAAKANTEQAEAHGEKKDEKKADTDKKEEKKADAPADKKEEKKEDGHGDKKEKGHDSKAEKKEEKSASKYGEVFMLPNQDLNLGNPIENRYLRITIGLEYRGGEEQLEELKKRQAQFTDIMISTVSSKTRLDLLTEVGKNKLRRELLNKFNEVSERPVSTIYFTEFVVE